MVEEKLILQMSGLTVSLRNEQRGKHTPIKLVDDVNLHVGKGEVVALCGESGSGKSITAMSIIGLLDKSLVASGVVNVGGRNVLALPEYELQKMRGNIMGIIFQDPLTSLNPTMKVGRQVGESIKRHVLGLSSREVDRRVVAALERARLPAASEVARAFPYELSGGMRQRVMIAVAIANNPSLLIADEPTTALDVTTQSKIIETLIELVEETEMAVIFITHDMYLAKRFADRLVIMYSGAVVEQGKASEVFYHNKHPYTHDLIGSAPNMTQTSRSGRLSTIPGEVPRIGEWPVGCRYANRCKYAREICREKVPQSSLCGEGHWASCWRLLDYKE